MNCIFEKESGDPCSARVMTGHDYCFFHNPNIPESDRKEAQSRGGKANAITVRVPLNPIRINGASDVIKLLEETINQVRAGDLDVKVANCVGFLSGHLLKAVEIESISTRVEVIERAILERRTRVS